MTKDEQIEFLIDNLLGAQRYIQMGIYDSKSPNTDKKAVQLISDAIAEVRKERTIQ